MHAEDVLDPTNAYEVFDLSRQLAGPMNAWASAMRGFWTHPALPASGTWFGRAMGAASEMVERATRRYDKPDFGIAATVVDRTPFCNLLRFAGAGAAAGPKVLIIAPLSGHHATLLRETVSTLVADHDVYITDWIDARLVPVAAGGFDLDDYVDLVIRNVRLLGPDVHVMAVCQPVVPVLAAISLMAEDGDAALPQTMTLMGGPVDVRVNPTAPGKLAVERPIGWFESTMVHRVPRGEPGVGRRVYPGFLQLSAFLAMNVERHARSHFDLCKDLVTGDQVSAQAHRRFYDEYFAVMDLPAEYYLQTVATVFQRHDLPRGEMRHRGRLVQPAAIEKTALLTIEGEKDDITGRGQTFAAHALCTGIPSDRRQHHLQEDAGHYGIFSGRRWRTEIAPLFADFIRRSVKS